MLQQTRYFYQFLQDERLEAKYSPDTRQLLFDRTTMRLSHMGDRMHDLTGNGLYADAAERFANAEYIIATRPLKHPSMPQVSEAAGPKR